MADFALKRHDRGEVLTFTLEDRDPDTGDWVPAPGLDTADSLTFIMRSTVGGPTGAGVLVTGVATYVAPGVVQYVTDADDAAYAGDYDCEVEVVDSPTVKRTYPKPADPADGPAYFSGVVLEDLDDA